MSKIDKLSPSWRELSTVPNKKKSWMCVVEYKMSDYRQTVK